MTVTRAVIEAREAKLRAHAKWSHADTYLRYLRERKAKAERMLRDYIGQWPHDLRKEAAAQAAYLDQVNAAHENGGRRPQTNQIIPCDSPPSEAEITEAGQAVEAAAQELLEATQGLRMALAEPAEPEDPGDCRYVTNCDRLTIAGVQFYKGDGIPDELVDKLPHRSRDSLLNRNRITEAARA